MSKLGPKKTSSFVIFNWCNLTHEFINDRGAVQITRKRYLRYSVRLFGISGSRKIQFNGSTYSKGGCRVGGCSSCDDARSCKVQGRGIWIMRCWRKCEIMMATLTSSCEKFKPTSEREKHRQVGYLAWGDSNLIVTEPCGSVG